MIHLFRNRSFTRPLPDPDLPALHALHLDPADQQELLRGYIEVWNTAQQLGKTEFSLEQAQDYHQRLGSTYPFLWFCMLAICAWVNVQAVNTTVEISVPSSLVWWRPFIAVTLSLFLVFLLDWLIASEIKKYLTWFDATRRSKTLKSGLDNAKGEINHAYALGQQQEAFNRVQNRYLSDEQPLSRLKQLFIIVVYLIEIIAALHSIQYYGEQSLIAYLAPLLGVLFSGLSGIFRGITIEYPKIRHKICTRYVHLAEEKPLDGLKREIQEANTITAVFLQQRSLRRETVEQVRQSVRTAEDNEALMENLEQLAERFHAKSQGLHQQYQTDINAWEDKVATWQENGRSINPDRKRLKFQKEKHRLVRNHLNAQLNLIEEMEHQLQNLYRRFPRQYQADCSFSQELAAKKREYQDQRSRLALEGMIGAEGSDSPKPVQESQDDQDQQDLPFDYP